MSHPLPKIDNDPGQFFDPIALSWMARHSPGLFVAAFGPQAAKLYSGMSLKDGLAEFSQQHDVSGFQAMMSTSDFAKIMDDVTNIAGVAVSATMLPEILKISHETVDIQDFKTIHRVDGGEFPTLKKTDEGGEVTYGSVPDRGETYSAAIYSRMLEITEQALANDNLGMLIQPRLRIAEAVLDTKATILAGLVESNPKLSDSKEVFHTDHLNLAGAGGLPTLISLNMAQTSMLRQKQNDGERSAPIDPAFLVVPPELKVTAEQLVEQITPAKTADVNPFSRSLEVVTEPRLVDPKAWYLFARPERQKSLEHGVVNGSADPDVVSERQIKTHSVITRVSLSFAAGWIDHRGAFKNPGE